MKMQTSGDRRREIANAYSVVIPRCAIAHLRAREARARNPLGRGSDAKWIAGLRQEAHPQVRNCAPGMTSGAAVSKARRPAGTNLRGHGTRTSRLRKPPVCLDFRQPDFPL